MITISPELKEAFNPNSGEGGRYIDYSLEWGVVNQDAQDNLSANAAEETSISRIAQVVNSDRAPLSFATFEAGGMPLDGSVVVPPRTTELPDAEIGLIMPVLSDADGYYASEQEIFLTLPQEYSWIGMTVNFGAVPARDFYIQYSNGGGVIHTTEVSDNTTSEYVDMQGVTGCNSIRVSITRSALSFHRVRFLEVNLGIVRKYNKTNSEGLEITETFDPLNERVPANELKISVENFAADFNIFDPSGLYKYLQSRQQLTPRIGALIADNALEHVGMGRYYLSSPELKNNFTRLDLKATDILGVLMDTIYTKGTYKTATMAQFADDVAADAGVTLRYPSAFEALSMATYIPTVAHAEAFRRIAQATGTYLYIGRDDVIEFSTPSAVSLQAMTKDDYKSGSGLAPSDDKIINTIEVEAAALEVKATAEKLAEVTGAGMHTVKYAPSTAHSAAVTGGTLTSATYYADNAVLVITGGTAVISGKKLVQNITTASANNRQAGEASLIYTVKGNPMIQAVNAADVATRYLQLKAVKRRLVKMQYRGYPYLEVADSVNFDTNLHETQGFVITKNTLKLGGGMTGTIETREAVI